MPGPDVVKHFKDNGKTGVDALRFSMLIECPAKRCDFAVSAKNGERQTISLTAPVKGPIPGSATLSVYLDVVQQNVVQQRSTPGLNPRLLEGIAVSVASFAVKLAQIVVPILSLTATMGILLYFAYFKTHRQSDWLFILATASAASVVMRCFIIAYIDITSWRAINAGYLGPCYPFMIIYSVTGTAILARVVDDLRLKGRWSHEVV
jgi:hypothetical protein